MSYTPPTLKEILDDIEREKAINDLEKYFFGADLEIRIQKLEKIIEEVSKCK